MQKKIIILNWKMNPSSLSEAIEIGKFSDKKGVVLCPPFIFLNEIKKKLKNAELGAQDISWINSPIDGGAFTGEISALMVKKIGCKYIILGHSERRNKLKEGDKDINKKIKNTLSVGLNPILCVGSDKKDKKSEKEIEFQLKNNLSGVEKQEAKKIIIAYEPVWAISTSKNAVSADFKDIKEKEIFIRKILIKLFDKNTAQKIKIIYGGSVDSGNIDNFIKEDSIDGVLIGGASLKREEMRKILKSV
jgi:triosephosphate isomerase (TIM)